MPPARPPQQPADRLAALRAPGSATPTPDPALDRASRLAVRLTGARMALATLGDGERQRVRGTAGLPAHVVGTSSLSPALCRTVVELGRPLVVEDARTHPLVHDDPTVAVLGGVAWLGVPLTTIVGRVLGSLWAIGDAPRAWSPDDLAGLEELAAGAAAHLAMREARDGAHGELAALRSARATGEAREARFRSLIESAFDSIAVLAPDGTMTYGSPAVGRVFGRPVETLIGTSGLALVHADDRERVAGVLAALAARPGGRATAEYRALHRDGGVRVVVSVGTNLLHDPAVAGIVINTRDVTEQRAAEATSARLRAVLEETPDIVVLTSPGGRLEYINRAGRTLLGVGEALPSEALTVADVQPDLVRSGLLGRAMRTALAAGAWRGETMLRKRDGRDLPVDQLLLAHRGPDGEVACLSSVMRDITERHQVESALRGLALVDELTGLYNRRGFLAMAEHEWRRAQTGGWPVLAFYLDVDDFKLVNDDHGHAEGDRALCDVAEILRATFRESDVLGRLGGDEFAVLVPHADDGTEEAVLARLTDRLRARNADAGRPCALSLSVGVAAAPSGTARPLADLVRDADLSLYERKRARKEQ